MAAELVQIILLPPNKAFLSLPSPGSTGRKLRYLTLPYLTLPYLTYSHILVPNIHYTTFTTFHYYYHYFFLPRIQNQIRNTTNYEIRNTRTSSSYSFPQPFSYNSKHPILLRGTTGTLLAYLVVTILPFPHAQPENSLISIKIIFTFHVIFHIREKQIASIISKTLSFP